jgi:DNA-binding IclR family transcriptional regulator
MALAASIGESFPLHAGAASKVLLAFMPEPQRNLVLAGNLAAHTPRTVTNAATMRAELARIRRLGWAEDRGEYSLSVRAVAAPVRDATGRLLGAISIADRGAPAMAAYRAAVCRMAADSQLEAA